MAERHSLTVDDLIAAPYNPRDISKEAADGLRASVARFGDIGGVTFNRATGRLVCGHQRVEQLRALGAQVVDGALQLASGHRFPIRIVNWTEAEEKAANVAANNPHIAGAFTDDLDALLAEVKSSIGPEDFGELRLDELLTEPITEPGGDGDGDATPDLPTVPRTKTGDVWTLGEHVLACGDAATATHDILKGPVDLVFTDPPYNQAEHMKNDGGLYATAQSPAMRGLAAASWDRGFSVGTLAAALDGHVPTDGTVYVCMGHRIAGDVWRWLDGLNPRHCSYCVWVKRNPMPSLSKRQWTWATELVAYASFGKHVFNFPDGRHAYSFWDIGTNPVNKFHPTQKPVAVPTHAILHSSNEGASVLDPFAGSGTTLIACENLSRKCYAVEIDPKYCDVIVERWEQLTGGKAQRN